MKKILAILLLAASSALAQQPNQAELDATRQQRDAANNQIAALAALIDKLSKELTDVKKLAESCKPVESKK